MSNTDLYAHSHRWAAAVTLRAQVEVFHIIYVDPSGKRAIAIQRDRTLDTCPILFFHARRRVFFDDNFLCTQKEKNPGARALLGTFSTQLL